MLYCMYLNHANHSRFYGRLCTCSKLHAVQQGCTLKQVIEDALREFFPRNK